MRMQKGLCIELNGEYSVFIGHNGKFVHGRPAGETAVGEESYFYPTKQLKTKKRLMKKPIWAPVIAAIAVAVLFLSVLLPRQEAFAYVQVQVNPGIELGIDEEYKVISIRELNPDGLELIAQIGEWKQHPLEEVLDEVMFHAVKGTTREIVITTVADEEDEVTDKAIVESIEAISTQIVNRNVIVHLKEASKQQWRTSVEESIPVGQLVSNSKNLMNGPMKEKQIEDQMEYPLKIKEKKLSADKQAVKKLKVDEKTEKKEEKEEKVEDKKEASPVTKEKKETEKVVNKKEVTPVTKEKKETEKVEDKKEASPVTKEKKETKTVENKKEVIPVTKEKKETEKVEDKKTTPPGQEQRKETPAVEKGNSHPPGQEKRNEKIEPDKKTKTSEKEASSTEKAKGNSAKQPEKKNHNIPEKSDGDSANIVDNAKEQETNGNKQNDNKSSDSKGKDKDN